MARFTLLIVVLLEFIKNLNGELSLEIVRIVDGVEKKMLDSLQELAGSNLTLRCRVIDTENSTSSAYLDEHLIWNRKKKDLLVLKLKDNLQQWPHQLLKPIKQFFDNNNRTAVVDFQPLFLQDSGEYFCESTKYNLRRGVTILVTIGTFQNEFLNYFHYLDKLKSIEKLNLGMGMRSDPYMATYFLSKDRFSCKVRGSIDPQFVCDKIKDCPDGSDESFDLCGLDPCKGKLKCNNGRCLSKSVCCDKYTDPHCASPAQPLCCFENNGEYVENHHDDDDDDNEYNDDDDKDSSNDWIYPLVPKITHDHDIHIPENKNKFYFGNKHEQYDFPSATDVHDVWEKSYGSSSTKILWIITPCVLILLIIIICVIAFGVNKSTSNRRSRTANENPHTLLSVSSIVPSIPSGNGNVPDSFSPVPQPLNNNNPHASTSNRNQPPNLDLPPSYDEVVTFSKPSAPPLD